MRVLERGATERVLATGRGVDLRDEPISPAEIAAAIRSDDPTLQVDCPTPTRWWRTLGRPGDDTRALDRVVAAARSRGHHPPAERELAAVQHDLQCLTVESVDTADSRRRLADAGAEVERLREAVATTRGRLQGRREMGGDTEDAEAALQAVARELSEAETERIAAEQAHEAAQRRAREAREARDRRLRLQDRVANRRRDTRGALARAVRKPFAAAVDALPGEATLSLDPLAVEGDGVTAALATARIADLRAPVVDATGRFEHATTAADALRGPVVLV